jgi:hypothetical protein
VLDREEKRLGFSGHARVWSFHIDEATGGKHLHAAWFRIDPETNRAHDPGLFKLRLMEVARWAEKEFGLRELSNARQPHDRARAPERSEMEESRRLGTDVRAIRTAILDCFEHADGGKAFKAALEERGLMLADGDRRDCFVVVDQAGGQHALNKKLTGQTLAETRARLADLDRGQLPSVEQAQDIQRERLSQIERNAEPLAPEIGLAAHQITEPHAPIWDRDAEMRAADEQIIDAAIRHEAVTAGQGSRQQPEPAAGGITPAEAPAVASNPTAAREPAAVHELAESAHAAIDRGVHAGEGVLRSLGRLFSGLVNWIADSLAPPPPPTKDQAERLARVADERQEQHAIAAAQQQIEAQRDMIAEQQRTRDIARTLGIASTGDPEEDRFRSIMQRAARDRDRDREAERER